MYRGKVVALALTLGVALILSACSGQSGDRSSDPVVTGSLHIVIPSDSPVEMVVGDKTLLAVSIEGNDFDDDESLGWSTSNATVADVDNSGSVTALSAGSSTITVTTEGTSGKQYSDSVTINVTVNYSEVDFTESYGFNDGHAWAIDELGNSYLINTKGEAVYSTNITASYSYTDYVLNNIDNGVATIGIYPDSDAVGWYYKCYTMAINTEGKVLHDGANKPFGDDVSELLCADNKIILLKHAQGFDENKLLIGVADLESNMVLDFQDVAGHAVMNITYLGEGMFYGTTSNLDSVYAGGVSFFYDSSANKLHLINGGIKYHPRGQFFNGLIRADKNDSGDTFLLNKSELLAANSEGFNPSNPAFDSYKITGYYGAGNYVEENIWYNAGSIYDLTTGAHIATISLDKSVRSYSVFNNGVISVEVSGDDGASYIAMFDRTGKQLLGPLKVNVLHDNLMGDYILIEISDNSEDYSALVNSKGEILSIETAMGKPVHVRRFGANAYSTEPDISYFREGLCPVIYDGICVYIGENGQIKISSIKVPQS